MRQHYVIDVDVVPWRLHQVGYMHSTVDYLGCGFCYDTSIILVRWEDFTIPLVGLIYDVCSRCRCCLFVYDNKVGRGVGVGSGQP